MHHAFRIGAILTFLLLTSLASASKGSAFPISAEAAEVCRRAILGDPDEAVALGRKWLTQSLESAKPELKLARAEVLTCLGDALAARDDLGPAEAAYTEAIAILEEGPSSIYGAEYAIRFAWQGLASLYEQSGRLESAIELFQKVLTRTYEPASKVSLLVRIGDLHLNKGRRRAAESGYQQALIDMRSLGAMEREQALLTYRNLANLYLLEERLDEAETNLDAGLVHLETFHGLDNQYTIFLSESQGWIYFHQGRFAEARTMALRALDYYESKGKSKTFFATNAKVLLARIEGAEVPGSPEVTRLLTSAVAAPIEEHEAIASFIKAFAQSELARHHLMAGNLVEAETLVREAVDGYAWYLGEDHFQTARIYLVLGHVLQRKGEAADALPYAQTAYARLQQVLPAYQRELGETLDLLAALYKALGQRENRAAVEELIVAYRAERERFEQAN